MKIQTSVAALMLVLCSNVAYADDPGSLYWFYETNIEKPLNSMFTVRHEETLDVCEDTFNEARGLDNKQPESIVNCMKEKGWAYVQHPAMSDGYYVIELCIFKQGKIVEAPFYTCNSAGAMPFSMSYSSKFSPDEALNDARDRFMKLQGGAAQ